MDPDRIVRFTGPYNLPDGVVPVVDGGEVFVESGSNDTWFLSGETVLQVCYRGDVDRLVRAAELLAVLPDGVPGPAVLNHGHDRLMSWMLVKRMHAGSRAQTGQPHERSRWFRCLRVPSGG